MNILITKRTYNFNGYFLSFSYIAIYLLLLWLTNSLLTNNVFYATLNSQYRNDQIEQIISGVYRLRWVGYFFVVFVLLIKWLLLSFSLYAVFYLIKDYNITFTNCLKIFQLAELAMIAANLNKVIYFLFNPPETLKDIQLYSPLSILQLLHSEKIPDFLIYPIQQLNVFEVGYCFLIVIGIHTQTIPINNRI